MMKKISFYQCDICGAEQRAKPSFDFDYNIKYVLPDNWTTGYNEKTHICPKCSEAIRSGNHD